MLVAFPGVVRSCGVVLFVCAVCASGLSVQKSVCLFVL